MASVGGSWLTPKDAILAGDWARITELAKAAAANERGALEARAALEFVDA
ncbi:hypothetical protein [Massilia cavernae]|nr:hypothetical protein [Massilia cavernae]